MIKIATVEQGSLAAAHASAGDIAAFLSVPYARPPIGEMCWKRPGEPQRWTGVRDANRYGPISIQHLPRDNSFYHPGVEAQSEDCLFLNIWSAARESSECRPVMIWFHLGAFMFGAASELTGPGGSRLFDGTELARSGVGG